MKRFKAIYAKDALGEVSRDIWEAESPSERNEALARTLYPNTKPKSWTVEDDIAEMRRLVDTGLIGMGWPPSGARLAVADDGSWREIAHPEDVGEGERHRWSFLWVDGAAPPLSEAYFLGKMAFCLSALEENLADGDMRGFLYNSMRLGMYQTEIDVRKIALRYADVGKRQLAAGEQGRNQRTAGSFKATYGEVAQDRAHELLTEKPGRTWRQIQLMLAKEYSVSAETIRKSISNPKKDR
ncbi:MAG: hypothetical protein WEB56_05355 [Roseovarius sp.]